jgi:ankyrin repeat domain-containing protein 50
MRLLKRQSDGAFRLTERITDDDIPQHPYAILSHTWGPVGEEVIFEDLLGGSVKHKAGYRKIQFCGEQAEKDGLDYFWVDTCCIKKSSDSELSESINSMFRWYQKATKCYVYLSDVSARERKRTDENTENTWEQAFRRSRWFTRGWTLQELLAPVSVEFFSSDGKRLGDRESLKFQIHEITRIAVQALEGSPLKGFSVSERKKWSATRTTTKKEDEAYSLIGVFDITMAIRYGEGREKAFQRLDSKIKKSIEQPAEDENAIKIIKWLAPPDPFINYEKALKQRQIGTGLWLLQSQRYTEWKSGRSQFLWLHGIPGCGKSILSSTIIEDLESMVDQPDRGAVVYFYFDFNDPQKRRSDLMVRSILAQLVRKCVETPTVLTALFSAYDKGQRQPPLSVYVDALKQMTTELPRIFFVLDALDECDSREELLEILSLISEWKVNNLQVLLTSRKERDIEDTLVHIVDNENIICLQSNLVDPDILVYIIERLSGDQKLKKWRKEKKIESVLIKKAHGMYVFYGIQYASNNNQVSMGCLSVRCISKVSYPGTASKIPFNTSSYARRNIRENSTQHQRRRC